MTAAAFPAFARLAAPPMPVMQTSPLEVERDDLGDYRQNVTVRRDGQLSAQDYVRVVNALRMMGWDVPEGVDLGSWLSKALRKVPGLNTVISAAASAIPGVGPVVSGVLATVLPSGGSPATPNIVDPATLPVASGGAASAPQPAKSNKALWIVGGIGATAALGGLLYALTRRR